MKLITKRYIDNLFGRYYGEDGAESLRSGALEGGQLYAQERRELLRRMVKGGFAFLALLYGGTLLRFLYPSKIKDAEIRFHYVLDADQLPKQGVKKIEIDYERNQRNMPFRAFLVGNKDKVLAFSPVCSHLGCLVDWSRHKGQFICPCHRGKYDIEGNVIAGPPPLPLTRLPLKVEEGKVYIGLKMV